LESWASIVFLSENVCGVGGIDNRKFNTELAGSGMKIKKPVKKNQEIL
jgi:hypothetical protein